MASVHEPIELAASEERSGQESPIPLQVQGPEGDRDFEALSALVCACARRRSSGHRLYLLSARGHTVRSLLMGS